jgi:universal stress protein A
MNAIKKIVVGVDFSEATEPVLQAAITVARGSGASLDVVHVRDMLPDLTEGAIPFAEQKEIMLDRVNDGLSRISDRLADSGLVVVTSALEGRAHTELVTHAAKTGADLIIVGTHGRSGIAHAVLGSVAERVVQKARRPVLVVPVG